MKREKLTFVLVMILPMLALAAGELDGYESRANEIRAIVSSPYVRAQIGEREITEIRFESRGSYEVTADGCQLKVRIGYERAVYPPEPSVHVNASTCRP